MSHMETITPCSKRPSPCSARARNTQSSNADTTNTGPNTSTTTATAHRNTEIHHTNNTQGPTGCCSAVSSVAPVGVGREYLHSAAVPPRVCCPWQLNRMCLHRHADMPRKRTRGEHQSSRSCGDDRCGGSSLGSVTQSASWRPTPCGTTDRPSSRPGRPAWKKSSGMSTSFPWSAYGRSRPYHRSACSIVRCSPSTLSTSLSRWAWSKVWTSGLLEDIVGASQIHSTRACGANRWRHCATALRSNHGSCAERTTGTRGADCEDPCVTAPSGNRGSCAAQTSRARADRKLETWNLKKWFQSLFCLLCVASRKNDFNHFLVLSVFQAEKSDLNHFFFFFMCQVAKVISITFLLSVPSRTKVISITFFPLAVFVCGSIAESLGKRERKKCSKQVIEESARKVISPPSLKLETWNLITFFDHFVRSLCSITFFDHFFRSLFSKWFS